MELETLDFSSLPIDVTVEKIVAGGFSACALLNNGRIWTWGDTAGPDLANGTLLGRPTRNGVVKSPGEVGLIEPCIDISCSTYSCLAVTASGGAYSWGDRDGNALGRMSDQADSEHDSLDAGTPTEVDGTADVVISRGALSYTNGGVVTERGEVRVWGGAQWKGGIGAGNEAAEVVRWQGVPACYACVDLLLAHRHAVLLFRKQGATVLI